MLKDAECKKGQLAQRPPILYVPVVDVVTPKEDSAVLKVKLPDDSHISVPIFSCGNNEEYIAHIVAILRIIEQKGTAQEVSRVRQGCCKTASGVEESPRSLGASSDVC
jgi:hypothetical protein